jgi:hypothetical protein
MNRETPSLLLSVFSSKLASASTWEGKHIHFNEQVEQYISLKMKSGEDEEPESYAIQDYDSSVSGDGAIIIKRTNYRWELPLISSRPFIVTSVPHQKKSTRSFQKKNFLACMHSGQ